MIFEIPALNRFFLSFGSIFRPPFKGLWLVVVLYVFWTFLVYPDSPTLRGKLPDTDDYMYLAQLLDWLKGQAWFDNIQHRLDPPKGVPIHFSRLAMLPMAVLTLAFEKLGLPPHGAAFLMAVIWPLALFSFFLLAVRWVAENFMPSTWGGVTAYVGLFATGTLFLFAPGHVDHHGLIVVLVTLALGCVLRMMRQGDEARWALYAGSLMALGLTIALEVLPWLLVMSAFIGLRGAVRGGKAAQQGLAYGLALYLGSVVCLQLTRPPEGFFVRDVLSYSIVYVFLTGGIALALAGAVVAAEAPRWVRLALSMTLALGTGFWFLHSFPDLINGPYGAMDPALAHLMLGEITETRPLFGEYGGWMVFLAYASSALVALPLGFAFMNHAAKEEREGWSLLMALLTAALALSAFYQRRFVGIMDVMAIFPLSVLLWRGWIWAARLQGRAKVYTEIGILLLAGPLPLLFVPALLDGRSFNTGVLLFPAVTNSNPCDMYVLENILRDPAAYGDRPRFILSTMDAGPELLFRTPHAVFSAPYHMDVDGNLDAARFFSTTDAAEAESIARRRHADLVVACRYVPDMYVHAAGTDAHAKEVMLHKAHFIELLMTDKGPDWLKHVRYQGLDNYAIYEVMPPEVPPPEVKKPKNG